uniref:Uncharacterized protein n=1 Tax=Kalanchoe fedtschenkoi TaxID=63787 RepID=A0A7N0U1I7_KALFE
MATNSKPLTTEAIALTEKKMDMTLDDIIKMSKIVKKPKTRVLNKNQKPFSNTNAQNSALNAKQFMASRTSMRQGALAKRRSNFQNNQFSVATPTGRRAATFPFRHNGFALNRGANWNNPRVPTHFSRSTNVGFNLKDLVLRLFDFRLLCLLFHLPRHSKLVTLSNHMFHPRSIREFFLSCVAILVGGICSV